MSMIPLIPALALSLFSFICSVFVILRIVIPVLPPSPLSKRVAPREFGLPNFLSLSIADQSHLWLAVFDILALAMFMWEVVEESVGSPGGFAISAAPASSVRIWIATTARQTALLFIAGLTLLYVRMGRPVSFGKRQWILVAPVAICTITSTALAGVLSGAGVKSFFIGQVAYSTTVTLLTTAAFGGLIGTLIVIRRNLEVMNEPSDKWAALEEEKQPRPSFATEDIDALKDGSSWITSYAGSRRNSLVSAFSFSTAHSGGHGSVRQNHPVTGSYPSLAPKSSYWFNPGTPGERESPIPPVPPLPSPYRSTPTMVDGTEYDPDPFRRSVPPQSRMGSQNSWLTESSGNQPTLSAWSFPTTVPGGTTAVGSTPEPMLQSNTNSRPMTPAMSSAQVLGGYGYTQEGLLSGNVEKGLASFSTTAPENLDVTKLGVVAWLLSIWVPLAFSLPFFFMITPDHPFPNAMCPIFLMLSVTLSSPLLAFSLLIQAPFPIPVGLFDVHADSSILPQPSNLPSAAELESRYKRSGSVTVVEGRRSGDVWISEGQAVDGRTKLGRALSLMVPSPKLSVIPPEEEKLQEGEITPPLPMQEESLPPTIVSTPRSEYSAEVGRMRLESKASSYHSVVDESLLYTSRIMIAQRHYSAVAKTMILPPSPEKRASYDGSPSTVASVTGVAPAPPRGQSHIRSRSASSIIKTNTSIPKSSTSSIKSNWSGPRAPVTPPPTAPLPPTPPRMPLFNTADFSFRPVDDMNEIDRLSAGMLPILVPGLRVGNDMKITEFEPKKRSNDSTDSGLFSSPELHSTPASSRNKKSSRRRRQHLSLPSLGLGRDGVLAWTEDITKALKTSSSDVTEDGRRRTVFGAESLPHTLSHLRPVREEDEYNRPLSPIGEILEGPSTRKFGATLPPFTRADVPTGIDTARSSMATLIAALEQPPISAASTQTAFSDSLPQAESTPRDARIAPYETHALTHDQPVKAGRRSSIVYIKSDENDANPDERRYSGRAQTTRQSNTYTPRLVKQPGASENSPGLRPLSLLQDKDQNRIEPRAGGIRPLALTKKQKQEGEPTRQYTPKKLARSATAKARGILRKTEVLPDVVVRPPSTSEHNGFAYNFR